MLYYFKCSFLNFVVFKAYWEIVIRHTCGSHGNLRDDWNVLVNLTDHIAVSVVASKCKQPRAACNWVSLEVRDDLINLRSSPDGRCQ